MDMDEKFMREALDLAGKGLGKTSPNPVVGAVIVRDGRVIGRGYHQRAGENHAEINAINSATESVEGATMYVSLEPCSHYGKTPPCADKLIEMKFGRVVAAMEDPNPKVAGKGMEKLRAAGIQTETGVLKREAMKLNEVFLKFITTRTPFVHLKTAMSADGKIATSTGESRWISCEESRLETHSLRGIYAGIMAGVQTVIADDPELTCRKENCTNPLRIIVDSTLRIPLESKVLKNQDEAPTVIATTHRADEEKMKALSAMGIQLLMIPERNGRVNLRVLMETLGTHGVDSVLLEGGSTLNYSALEEGIVDKASIYIAPIIIGGAGAPSPVGGEGIHKLDMAYRLKDITCGSIGSDFKIEGYIDKEV
ncbi:bifunctional diaminohydroxyphosphoribosylaminopyrimidine deaminase/5-amino-6-(5-phosphoribosylamino)uracil reductase RibD [Parasporobacterium paucivorans]|uniref:Riboflavin biosynthesis protein RibD n=1 Tax=Parasporobacterium paucivorans DSM 15970 TaxID=1122934 RepID=A0A1M6KQK3_9FIRM|nr:bifunctional diaminohydroxyphosphoribosylaminopyrimidine deaminase/5-amino-6-(5-phosphoribosylamino)uracil reductase RibD [Parasporobacterium paucivorans]SHJ61191.1 diaminohydroxyphosphoribosylaminopyrimidine deaminase [Parasporobacterium paucivorans DSM 15970]